MNLYFSTFNMECWWVHPWCDRVASGWHKHEAWARLLLTDCDSINLNPIHTVLTPGRNNPAAWGIRGLGCEILT